MKKKKKLNISEIEIFKFLAIVIVLCIVIDVGYLSTKVTSVKVSPGAHYSEEEIEDIVMDNFLSKSSIVLYLKYKYLSQKSIPFVEYIDVELLSRNEVEITVYDKNIIGCTKYMNKYIYFDKDGMFVESSTEKHEGTAFITGLNFKSITLYDKLDVEDDKIFDIIIGLNQQISKYGLVINEINFDEDYNVTLYTDDITVMLGKKETYDEQLAKLPEIFDEARTNDLHGVLHLENYSEGMTTFNFEKM